MLVFSAAAYEVFKSTTYDTLQNLQFVIDVTPTLDQTQATVSDCASVLKNNVKLFVINFYHTKSKVLINGKPEHMVEFISSTLKDIIHMLDQRDDFREINASIKSCCDEYLKNSDGTIDKSNTKTRSGANNTATNTSHDRVIKAKAHHEKLAIKDIQQPKSCSNDLSMITNVCSDLPDMQ